MKYYKMEINEVLKELSTSRDGLSSNEVEKRIKKYGYASLPKKKSTSIFKLFFEELFSPMEIILLIAVLFSFFIGEVIDAFVLLLIIFVDVIMGTIQEYKARKKGDALLNMIKDEVCVLRDKKEVLIDSKYVVVGDILILSSGNNIGSDARIIESSNFYVNEASLTGESENVLKTNSVINKDVILSERNNMIYAGCNVVSGRAKAVVCATSINTEIGKLAKKINEIEKEDSPLTIRVNKFVKQISIIIVILSIIIASVLYIKGYDIKDIFLNVISLSVSAMPEGLALALTMALTLASTKMLKKNVIVKNLSSVESLGSCTVIATDKTGTLTLNKQTAKKIILKDGSTYEITGDGYNDLGKVIAIDNASIDKVKDIAFLGMINNEAKLEKTNNKFNYIGDSIDIGFLSLAYKLKLKKNVKIIKEIPYESELGYSCVFYEMNNKKYCTVKGSIEKILNFSKDKDNISNILIEEGYRVIGIVNGEVKNLDLDKINNLSFIGVVGFTDPVRSDVKKSIKEAMNAGIKVIMITGDHYKTAVNVARELDFYKGDEFVVTGSDLLKFKDRNSKEFDEFIKDKNIFSRVTPMDKLDIVNSLKRSGEFIAVTGDGVNDALALKSANIGISMGSGVDVSKEEASMIIKDDSFKSIVLGIKEGRIAYSNIRNIILFLLSCGLAEVLLFLLSIIFNLEIPLVAIQLLWLNVVTDGLQDISLSYGKGDSNIMKQKPRSTKESLFSKDLIIEIIILGFTITTLVFLPWKFLMDNNYDLLTSRSIIMMLIVFIQNINVLNCISEKESLFTKHNKNITKYVILTLIISCILQIIVTYIPITSKMLKITPIPIYLIIILLFFSSLIIFVFEIYKYIYKKLNKI